MASAKTEAKNQLGSEDKYIGLSALNKERDVANNVYNTNVQALKDTYNRLLQTAENNRVQAKTDFNSGRSDVSQNAYLSTRGITADRLGARGVSSGTAQLGKFGTALQSGRANSDLANTYYGTMDDIQNTVNTGTSEYNTNMSTAKNVLDKALADIATREANNRNAYKLAVAQLAEQIASRRAAEKANSIANSKTTTYNPSDLVTTETTNKTTTANKTNTKTSNNNTNNKTFTVQTGFVTKPTTTAPKSSGNKVLDFISKLINIV